jgi:hypothetical protein
MGTIRRGDYLLARLLLDRRQFLQGLGAAALGATGVGLLTGCGGGGSGGGGGQSASSTPASGRVALPSGTTLSPTSLSVVSGGSVNTPAASGQFQARVYTAEPSLAVLTNSAGNSLLLGFIDPQSGSSTIDATSTAVALLYFAIGGPTVPPANKAQILQLLAAHAVTPLLASTIATRTAADPLALQNGDTQITAALQSAYTTLTANVLRAAAVLARPVTRAAALSRAAAPPLELIQPTGQQSGIEVVQPDNVLGVQAINHFRRRAQMFLYRVGEVSTAGVTTNYPAVVSLGDRIDISATTALGLFTTLDNLFSGATAFTPVTTPPQALTLQPNTKQTNFEVVVLGASGSPNPPFFGDPKYAAASPTWVTNVGNLNLFTAIGDMALGFILELWGLRFVITDAAPIQAVLDGLAGIQAQVPTMADLLARARAGKFSDAIADLIELAATSDIVSSNIKQALRPYILQLEHEAAVAASGPISSKLMASAFRLISAAFTPVGITMGVGDLAAIAHDLANSNPGDLWTANLVQPTFTLNPATASTAAGGRVTFSVQLPVGATGKFAFDWTQTSPYGTLSASNGKVGNSLETTDASVTVDLVTTGSDTQTITVTVTAYEVDASGNKSQFGVATAKVTIDASTTVQAGSLVFTRQNADGSIILFGFYTFSTVPGATSYGIYNGTANSIISYIGSNLTAAEIAKGAPVLDQGSTSSQPFNESIAYKVTNHTQGFFNLGGGLIGYYIAPGNFPPGTFSGDVSGMRQNLVDFFAKYPAEVKAFFY